MYCCFECAVNLNGALQGSDKQNKVGLCSKELTISQEVGIDEEETTVTKNV